MSKENQIMINQPESEESLKKKLFKDDSNLNS